MTSEKSAATALASCPVSNIVREFDPWRDEFVYDPYPFYAQARQEEGIFYSPQADLWIISRYDDIWTVLRDPARFSAANALSPVSDFTPQARQILVEGGYTLKPALTNNDPPGHTRVRSHINKVFSARRIAQMEPRIRHYANTLLDTFVQDGQVDLTRHYAFPLPMLVIFNLIGIPDEDMEKVKNWCGNRTLFLFGKLSPQEQIECAHNMVAFWKYTQEFCEERRLRPKDDLTSDLAATVGADETVLSMHEVASVIFGLSFAGHETTTNLIGNGMWQLLSRPELWQQICDDPTLIENAVEEILRFDGSVPVWRRITTQEVELSGVKLPKGSKLGLLLGSGNHDESYFARPQELDLRRENARNHLGFGKGIHFCVGAPLARLEAKIALEVLAQRLPGLRLVVGQTIEYVPTISFRGPKQLLIEWN